MGYKYNPFTSQLDRVNSNVQTKFCIVVGPTGDLGYITDGTSDQVQIQAAIDAVETVGGGIVQIQAGTFYISARIVVKPNVWIKGVGMYNTILRGTAALTDGIFFNSQVTYDPYNTIDKVKISDLTLYGYDVVLAESVALKGVRMFYGKLCVLENIYCTGFPATGLAIDFPQDCLAINCIVEECGRAFSGNIGFNGFGIGTSSGDPAYEESMMFANCWAIGNGNNGFLLEYQDTSTTNPYGSRNFLFTNCISRDNGRAGFRSSSAAGVGIINCKSFNNGKEGVDFEEINFRDIRDNTVMGCDIYDNGSHGIRSASTDIEDGRNFVCIGNRIWGNGDNVIYGGHGVSLGSNRAKICNNVIFGNHGSGINYHPSPDTAHGAGGFIEADPGPAVGVIIAGNTVYNNGQANYTVLNDGREGIKVLCGSAQIDGLTIADNDVYDDQDTTTQAYGIYVEGPVYNVIIRDNRSYGNNRTGIQYYIHNVLNTFNGYNVRVTNNIVYNNGKASQAFENYGIGIKTGDGSTLTDVLVAMNRCFDNQGTKTQKYGVVLENVVTQALVINNDLRGNLTGAVLNDLTDVGGSPVVDRTVVYRNNKGLNPDEVYAQGNVTGATTFNLSNGSTITATLTGNITVTLTNGASYGDRLSLILTQDGTGSRAVTWPSNFKKAGGTLTLSTAASAVDTISMIWDGTNWREVSRSMGLA